jgi:hypothetical protein
LHQISVAACDALAQLIERGFVRQIGYAVEIVPESMRETDVLPKVEPSAPAHERRSVKRTAMGAVSTTAL